MESFLSLNSTFGRSGYPRDNRKQRRISRLDPYPRFLRHAKETYSVDRRNYTAHVPHESHITHSATLSASTNPDGRLTDLVPKDTMIMERQFDFAKERMLEQVLLLSGGYWKRSIMYQFSLHCVDGAAEFNIAFAPTHERPEQSEENKILSLRVTDLATVVVMVKQDKETQQNILVLTLHVAQERDEEGTTTADGRSETHMDITMCTVLLFGSGALLHDDLFSLAQSAQMCFFIFSSSQQKVLVGSGHLGHLVHALFFGIQCTPRAQHMECYDGTSMSCAHWCIDGSTIRRGRYREESHFLVTLHWKSYATKNELASEGKAYPLLSLQTYRARLGMTHNLWKLPDN